MVIAPIKKNTIWAVPINVSDKLFATCVESGVKMAYTLQSSPAPSKALADLLTFMGCSNAIAR